LELSNKHCKISSRFFCDIYSLAEYADFDKRPLKIFSETNVPVGKKVDHTVHKVVVCKIWVFGDA
jgi:hypothetical protein